MRRKAGTLIPLEEEILETGLALRRRGQTEFHGFLIAKEIQQDRSAAQLTGHGTLYKALDRLEKAGFLESEWEDPDVAVAEGRPRRRLYRVTSAGESALSTSRAAEQRGPSSRRVSEAT